MSASALHLPTNPTLATIDTMLHQLDEYHSNRFGVSRAKDDTLSAELSKGESPRPHYISRFRNIWRKLDVKMDLEEKRAHLLQAKAHYLLVNLFGDNRTFRQTPQFRSLEDNVSAPIMRGTWKVADYDMESVQIIAKKNGKIAAIVLSYGLNDDSRYMHVARKIDLFRKSKLTDWTWKTPDGYEPLVPEKLDRNRMFPLKGQQFQDQEDLICYEALRKLIQTGEATLQLPNQPPTVLTALTQQEFAMLNSDPTRGTV